MPEVYLKMAKIDKEQLAVEVQKFVYLYDKSNPQYKNRVVNDQAWAKIATQLGIEGESTDGVDCVVPCM